VFNIDEGEENDALSISDAVEHILQVMTYDLLQIECYKLNRLCSTYQYLIIDDKRVTCSGLWIRHLFFFLPFVKKEIREICYRFNPELSAFEKILVGCANQCK